MTKPTLQKIGLIFFGILLGLLILEVGLRIGGYVLLTLQRHASTITDENGEIYRILALGESTTANLRNGQSSWPEELEIILNNRSKKVKFKVFNEGIPGTTTSKILLNLESNLDKYKPDMVITMVGINDVGLYVKNKNTLFGHVKRYFEDFRIYKLFNRIIDGLKFRLVEYKQEQIYKKKENELKKALEIDQKSAKALTELESFYYSNEKFEELESVANSHVKIYPNNIDAIYNLGVAYRRLNKYKEAEEMFKKVIEINPNNHLALFSLGAVYKELGKYKEAEEMFKKAIEVYPNFDSAYLGLGDIYYESNKSKETITMYLNFMKIAGPDERVIVRLTEVYVNLNWTNESYKMLKFHLLSYPDREAEIFSLAELSQKLNKSDEVIPFIKLILSKKPDNFVAYTELIWHYLDNGRVDEANKMFNKAMESNPWFLIKVYDNIGIRYQKNSNVEKADEMFNKASELRKNYHNPNTEQNYRDLYKLVSDRGLTIIMMQYPSLSIDSLKSMFKGNKKIIFASNEQNFKKALSLSNATYEEYFIDRISGWPFGHATKKGNQLIAENLANVIIEMVGDDNHS